MVSVVSPLLLIKKYAFKQYQMHFGAIKYPYMQMTDAKHVEIVIALLPPFVHNACSHQHQTIYSLKQQNNINTVMYTSSTLPTINISVCLLTSAVIVIGDKIVCNCSIGSEIVQYSYILWHKTTTTIIIIINGCLNVI